MTRYLPDRFVMLMIASVVLATLIPAIGRPDGPLHLGLATKIGIGLIFFLHGAKLSPKKLKTGALLWRVHALTQATTFILFPLLGLALYFATAGILPDPLRLGFFFLAAVPSTVSSSVALTGMGKGNVPVAVFNATLSGLIGLFLTPAIIAVVSKSGNANFSVVSAMIDIAQTLLLPFALGQLARPLIGGWIDRYKWLVSGIDRGVILLIVFTSFAGAIHAGVFTSFAAVHLILTFFLVCIMLIIALSITTMFSRQLKLERPDETAAVFCGATKSLANGAPIAQIIFSKSPDLAIILLPLMLYHQLQLIICAVLANRYAKAAGDTA